jgi:hypothetical protein
MSYRTDEKHLQHEKEREHEKEHERLRDQQGAQHMRIIHPGVWLLLGFVLTLAILFVWFVAWS